MSGSDVSAYWWDASTVSTEQGLEGSGQRPRPVGGLSPHTCVSRCRNAISMIRSSDDWRTNSHRRLSLRSSLLWVHMSACIHITHDSCMATYFNATRIRHIQQVQRHQSKNAVRQAYLCPLSKSLGDILMPLVPTQACETAGLSTFLRNRSTIDTV